MEKQIKRIINKVKKCARGVYEELGPGWNETVYQQAMEVALRECKIAYETQRNLPITFSNHVVGESKPDLVVWLTVKNGKRLAIVIDLKWEPYLKADHHSQVAKYIQELKKQVKKNEQVWNTGFVINFPKEKSEKIEKGFENHSGVQVLEVKA